MFDFDNDGDFDAMDIAIGASLINFGLGWADSIESEKAERMRQKNSLGSSFGVHESFLEEQRREEEERRKASEELFDLMYGSPKDSYYDEDECEWVDTGWEGDGLPGYDDDDDDYDDDDDDDEDDDDDDDYDDYDDDDDDDDDYDDYDDENFR